LTGVQKSSRIEEATVFFMQYKVIDNLLDEEHFVNLHNQIVYSSEFPWYITTNISGEDGDEDYYFTHLLYNWHYVNSDKFDLVRPLLDKLNIFSMWRIKANFYPTTKKIIKHKYHQDHVIPHTGCVFYLNTNNGKTILDDGTEIDSIQNRALIFDAHIKHRSTTCTDDPIGRFNINFNYFSADK